MGAVEAKRGPIPDDDLASSYTPVVRVYLVVATTYNLLICLSHPFFEKGMDLLVLEGLAVAAVITGASFWRMVGRRPPSLHLLEVAALAMNAIFLANVFAYQTLHFEPLKLVYFVLLGLAFATAAPTRRVAGISVATALAAMMIVALDSPGDPIGHYAYIGLAGAFTALGMSALMRGTVLRELRARLASEALNRSLEQELEANRLLRARAETLTLEAEAANRAKSEFLATMSHEIRTPLNGVLGTAQAMERGELSDDQRRRLDIIRSSGQSLLQVINAILDISQIEAGRMEIVHAPFSLDDFADGLRRLYGGLAEERGLAFSLTLDPTLQDLRLGDASRLRQVLSNLISNAIKFSDDGRIAVRLSGDADRLTGSVADTGVGIPVDRLGEVFDKFVQIDGSTTRRTGGSGLGLAICKELLTLMGGSIRVERLESGGSCFSFELPCPAVADDDDAPPQSLPAAEPLALECRVLVVDDNATNRVVLETMLEHLGIASASARDGREAVELWTAGGWDAILMDIHMPRMDGLEACREIRRREAAGDLGRTPIIAVTASVFEHEIRRYYLAGIDGFVAKPIEIGVMVQALEAALTNTAPVSLAV